MYYHHAHDTHAPRSGCGARRHDCSASAGSGRTAKRAHSGSGAAYGTAYGTGGGGGSSPVSYAHSSGGGARSYGGGIYSYGTRNGGAI